MTWQPISTAPDDQTAILAVHERSGNLHLTWREAIGADRYVRHFEPKGSGWRPTHWMPLPTRPEVA